MSAEVERLQAAIEKLQTLRAATEPVRSDSEWVVDYATTSRQPILVLDSHNGGYDGSVVGEMTSEARAVLIVTLHRTIDAQLGILRAAHVVYSSGITVPEWLDLADAILGDGMKDNA